MPNNVRKRDAGLPTLAWAQSPPLAGGWGGSEEATPASSAARIQREHRSRSVRRHACSYGYYRGASGQPRQYARASAKDLAAAATTTSTLVSEAHSLDQAAKSTSGSLQLGRLEESQLIRHRGARFITCHD
jgi:hypothetical protein